MCKRGKNELSLEEIHEILLEIMSDIDDFCRTNGIRYSISSGTLLGAVRHKGFIPWDDDVDMFMLRSDFDRFVATYRNRRYRLLFNTRTDREFFACGNAKVCDPSTDRLGIDFRTRFRYGVNVDIFPLDGVPDDPKSRKKYMHKVMRIHNRLWQRHKRTFIGIPLWPVFQAHLHSFDWWWEKCWEEVHRPERLDCNLVAHIIGTQNDRTVLPGDVFDTLSEICFEGKKFWAFSDTDAYLSMVYGADYMTPPPLRDRVSHNYKICRVKQ